MVTTRREAVPLDGLWEFVPDPEHGLAPDHLPAGSQVPVPGPWESAWPEPYGIVHAWYRRRFRVPDDWADGHLVLRFGSAMTRATVWLDGRFVGEDRDGYLPFEIDAGDPRPGTERELVVAVENPLNVLSTYPAFDQEAMRAAVDRLDGRSFDGLPRGKQTWYTSTSGLLGSVVAELAPDPRFASLLVLPDLHAAQALVRWRLAGSRAAQPATVLLTVTSPTGQVVAQGSADARSGETVIAVPDPDPWDLWRPSLYRLDARISTNLQAGSRRPVDRGDDAIVRFGMRSIAVSQGTILLNGRPLYLRGALDQDFWPVGRSNPPSRRALEAQVGLAREMGLNLLRCHIKIPDPAYLDVADEAGILVWCELPNWSAFDVDAAATGRRMLARMVETMGNHPSVVAWTVINEDWGTDLHHEARDRRWLRTTTEWLKATDPSRLVVDNSACESSSGPGFHVRTDLIDYHVYRSMPDGLPEWRSVIGDFARRPAWLWSPHGDALDTGDEVLVLSEFGGWGLPKPTAVDLDDGDPWWSRTGQTFCRPAGIRARFQRQELGRIWSNVDHLAEATQWRQFEGLTGQIRELRRHPSIKSYVITELSDAYWEANGLLDVGRGTKAYHDRLADVNNVDLLIVDLPRCDLWGRERLATEVILSSFPDSSDDDPTSGHLDWQLRLADGTSAHGSSGFPGWPRSDACPIARVELHVPDVRSVTTGELIVTATGANRGRRAVYRQPVVVVPDSVRRTASPRRVAVVDPLDLWSIGSRMEALGHRVARRPDADLTVACAVDRGLVADLERGRGLLLLCRSSDAIPDGIGLSRSMTVRPRRPIDGSPAQERPWDGDWTSVFAWALPGILPGIEDGGLLGDPHTQIFPDQVLDGLDVAATLDGVEVGLFTGWVHSPAALLAAVPQGAGHLIATTLRLAPEDGPVATALLESLIQRAGHATMNP